MFPPTYTARTLSVKPTLTGVHGTHLVSCGPRTLRLPHKRINLTAKGSDEEEKEGYDVEFEEEGKSQGVGGRHTGGLLSPRLNHALRL